MIVNLYDRHKVYTGSIEQSLKDPMPSNSTLLSIPDNHEGSVLRFTGNGWEVLDSYPVIEYVDSSLAKEVPNSVTKRQGRQQLILMGIIDQVQPAIDQIVDPIDRALVQSFWDDSTQYERYHPQMVQLARAIGLTDEQLDQAFIDAASRL